MDGTIAFKEVLDLIDTGLPCNLMYVSANKITKEAGEEIYLHNARKQIEKKGTKKKQQPSSSTLKSNTKNPNHFDNSTRNLLLQNGEIRKCHIRLIRIFNGKTVL